MKTISSGEHASLVRYLLGELTEPEREQIEERYLLDEQYGELLDELETDLVDAYVEGTLTREQRQHFETRYLVTLERNAAVQAAYLSKVYRDRVANPLPISASPASPQWLQWAAGKRQFVPVMAAGLAMVILGGGAWLLFDRGQVKREVEILAENRPAAPAAPVQDGALTKGPVAQRSERRVVPTAAATAPGGRNVTTTNRAAAPSNAGASTGVRAGGGDHFALNATTAARSARAVTSKPEPFVPLPDEFSLNAIRRALVMKYQTAFVGPNAVVVLKQGNLAMAPVSSAGMSLDTYHNGRISQSATLGKFNRIAEATKDETPKRIFVAGEKIWVTKIDVQENGVVLDLFSGPYAGVRYAASLWLPFEKNSTPTVSYATQLLAEVFDVQPSDPGAQRTPTKPPNSLAAAPPAQIPQPTTATGQPAQIAVGQTIDEVVAALGQPPRIIDLTTKKIYVYKDMKITFKAGKVADVH